MEFIVTKNCDYVVGHLRYGYLTGVIEADSLEEAREKLKQGFDGAELVVTDYAVDHYQPADEDWEITPKDGKDYLTM